jgi:predicted membrane protein
MLVLAVCCRCVHGCSLKTQTMLLTSLLVPLPLLLLCC